MPASAKRPSPPTPADYRALAAFRNSLRRFLDFSAKAAKHVGLTPQHYQALLALKAASDQGPTTVGALARELLLRHHSAVELLDRLEERNLVRRVRSTSDRRAVELQLTKKGESVIARLAATHHEELSELAPKLRQALRAIGQRSALLLLAAALWSVGPV
ncbi:MAG: MarR family transcriptional regulator [Opitutae bacterium]|nr:MarR family transcriptional regulator [Opitutae bacterium]